jgi:hypothetical protein
LCSVGREDDSYNDPQNRDSELLCSHFKATFRTSIWRAQVRH